MSIDDTNTQTPRPVDDSVIDRVKSCESDYIGTRLISDENESITDRSGPIVVTSRARSDGAYLEVETQVGTVRSVDGEPDENADYVVTAGYFVTDEMVYRTTGFESDGNPRDGTTVDC